MDQPLPARCTKATFSYLRAFSWRRVVCWLRHKENRALWKQLPLSTALSRKMVANGAQRSAVQPGRSDGHPLHLPGEPYFDATGDRDKTNRRVVQRNGLVESRMRGNAHVRFGGADRGNDRSRYR